MHYKLGKHPAVHDHRTLKFGKYLTSGLPEHPAEVDYGRQVKKWPLYDNDVYGDCTCAAAGHMIQNWTANAGTEVTPPATQVVKFFESFVGTPPPADSGCDMLAVLKRWRNQGLGGHRIAAFAALKLKDHQEAKNALYLTGTIYLGVNLPDFTMGNDQMTIPWDVPTTGPKGKEGKPDSQYGHCINAVAYDDDGLHVITWGEKKKMSWGFYDDYCDEAFAVISDDFIGRSGTSPAGLDLAALHHDLAQL